MDILNWFLFTLVIIISSVIAISFWARKALKYKIFCLSLGFISFFLIYISFLEILSRPKPKELELLNRYLEELTLLHVSWTEGKAIHILVQIEGLKEPRLYKFPWDPIQAQEFDEALEKGRENGEEVRISNPFYDSNVEERKTLIYSAPAKPLPKKEEPKVGITAYDPDAEKKSYEKQKKIREKEADNRE
tara:strand:- start:12 stop:581 length:570 start_codon:yes stop_codon:yes gene_type:complete